MKTIFLSYDSDESKLAGALATKLNNAFEGKLTIRSAARDISSGDNWKKWIRDNLNACDAGIFLLTPGYLNSHWLTTEFAAFWLAEDREREVFFLSVGNPSLDDVFSLIKEKHQISPLDDEGECIKFVKKLSKFVAIDEIPYEALRGLSSICADALYINKSVSDKYKLNYFLNSTEWTLKYNESTKCLDGICKRIEHFKVCDPNGYSYIPVKLSQDANLLQLADADLFSLELNSWSTSMMPKVENYHGRDREWRIKVPPLNFGDEFKVEYTIKAPSYKTGTAEKFTERNIELITVTKDPGKIKKTETFIKKVNDPTERFEYIVKFDDEYQYFPWEITARVGKEPFKSGSADVMSANENPIKIICDSPAPDTVFTIAWEPLPEDKIFQKRI
jgi:hypothetical protein